MKKYFTNFIIIILFYFTNIAQAVIPSKKSSLVINPHNGKILHAENEHAPRYPASLVKMMTLYLTFEQIKLGNLTLKQKLLVSKKAASMPRTNLALKAGSYISTHDAILGLIVHSSNDAAVVLAENIAGSEANFAKLMNIKAKKLGMNKTVYYNASGWHHKHQKSTAYDLAKLAMAIKNDFPKFFPWFSICSFTFNGKTYHSHNHVVRKYPGATGLKTGFTNPSGFNLATTANKKEKQLVGVVLGENTASARDKYMMKLLDKCFKKIDNPAIMQSARLKHSKNNK
jgi:D-alanyl-D-alanine carboxypeptidase (penicillin-binding protein 5/6)